MWGVIGLYPHYKTKQTPMAGLYLHIPYCKQACNYCDFYFRTETKSQGQFVDALCRELAIEAEYLGEKPVTLQTVYFGGGTPSRLPDSALSKIIEHIEKNYRIDYQAEITLEANPEDISSERLKAWRQMGVNRLSIGVQTFQDELLEWMHRAHNGQQALVSIEATLRAGFDNLTVDFIYAIPGLTEAKLIADLQKVVDLGVPHISAYALTVEPRTRLSKDVALGKAQVPDDDTFERHFDLVSCFLSVNGYEHYEISNFAKPGRRARHNSSYWRGIPYLGVGPSAHSYQPGERRLNLPDLHAYITALESGNQPSREIDKLDITEQLNDMLLTRLRTLEGVTWAELNRQAGRDTAELWRRQLEIATKVGNVILTPEGFALTHQGRKIADTVIGSFFVNLQELQ